MVDLEKLKRVAAFLAESKREITLKAETVLWLVNQVEKTLTLERRVEDLIDVNAKHLKQRFKLTDKQAAVALCIADGLTNKEAAQKLGLSPETVKTHLRAIYNKTNLKRSTIHRCVERSDNER